ncbi:glucokinase [Phenylobacterium immobile]|uniref:glucokinase n=1 Tax=Phenylobacterium immobile TaxID=21 RepID=UPI000A82E556|nr:glucokinase [Phenylobacterium immobile]
MKIAYLGLVGDVGGTNARLALVDEKGHVRHPKVFPSADYSSLSAVIEDYLNTTIGGRRLSRAVLAVAGPVADGEIEFTNLDWTVTECDLMGQFEFEAVRLINDFAAQALACPRLEPDELRPIGPVLKAAENQPLVVLGAGTGFGVAGLARSERGDIAISTEGGHMAFAPTNEVECKVLEALMRRFGRVSVERVLSGPGLYDLYRVLCDIAGAPATAADPPAVFAAGEAGDPIASQALDVFCGVLGAVAGDLALAFGARGGVYVSGGIAPRMFARLNGGAFRRRFEDKGRLSDFVSPIPTFLVQTPYPAITGAARELMQMGRLI